jgi:hypothetical protein
MTARPSPRPPRRAAAGASLAITLVACSAACGLSVSGTGDEATTTTGSPHPGSGGNPVKPVDAGSTTTGKVDGASPTSDLDGGGVVAIDDAGAPDVHLLDPDASYEEAGDPCDLDEDGYQAAGSCGGNDCCDFDSRAHPGDTSYYATKDACGSFDYDCDGQNELQYTQTASCKLGFFACSGSGFDKAPPECGVGATFDTCPYDVLFCGGDQTTVVQSCR